MQYRPFGKTNWQVSEIGFGAWQLGGTWGKVDDQESIDTLLYAFSQGINFVDTAALYGAGRSEEVVGKALRQWQQHSKDPIYIASKIPPAVWNQQMDIDAPMRGRYPLVYAKEQVESCLRRLNIDCLDLIQLHGWYHKGCYELDWLEALNTLKSEGKVQHIGVSLHDARPDQGVMLAKLGLVDSIQVLFNIFEQEPMLELFPAACESNTAIIARVPLDSGSLTGTWTKETIEQWPGDDKRHQMYAKDGNFEHTLERIEKIKDTCTPYYTGLAEAALRFVLHHKAVSLTIPGMRNGHEVDLNIHHSDGAKFPNELVKQLRQHTWKHSFY
ncbi:aldo/keto reductase [Verrucomicrobiaceae bacterium N1E253]|uniref:Aldo/keto reductase n=1 Tax=Oceaniferula marina TaxID=2748318 RepID=A0A851G940_9BACT|nr:aldo/keto reductase [Oceaniferula marina]NWK54123.1 aldo/keto reductase [Oceaniferula marina]